MVSVSPGSSWTRGQPWSMVDVPRDSSWIKLISPLPVATNSFKEDSGILFAFSMTISWVFETARWVRHLLCESDSLLDGQNPRKGVGRELPSQSSHLTLPPWHLCGGHSTALPHMITVNKKCNSLPRYSHCLCLEVSCVLPWGRGGTEHGRRD